MYTPGGNVEDPAVAQELLSISRAIQDLSSRIVPPSYAAPDKPRDGMLVYADGTDWDPGSGEGFYSYYNSTWNFQGGGGGAEQLSDLSDVGVTTPTDKNALMADGDSWESRALVEADISDLGTYLKNVVEDTTPELGGNLDCLEKQVISPELSDFSVEDQIITDSGTVDLDYEAGQSIQLNPDGNITTQTFSNWPTSECGQMEVELNQDNPARTIAWDASIEWVEGTAPDITTADGKWLIHFRTRDGGTSVLGTYAGPFS